MDADVLEEYWAAITAIEAQGVLIKMRLMDYPNMKEQARNDWHTEMNRLAFPPDPDAKPLSDEELVRQLHAAIGD